MWHRNTQYLKILSNFRRHEPKTEYEIEQEALTHAFAGNTFDKLHNKKYGGHYDQDDQEDRVEMEMGKMVEKRTKMLWDVSLQAAQATQAAQNPDNDSAILQTQQSQNESVHDKIKAAYDRSKNSFKKE